MNSYHKQMSSNPMRQPQSNFFCIPAHAPDSLRNIRPTAVR